MFSYYCPYSEAAFQSHFQKNCLYKFLIYKHQKQKKSHLCMTYFTTKWNSAWLNHSFIEFNLFLLIVTMQFKLVPIQMCCTEFIAVDNVQLLSLYLTLLWIGGTQLANITIRNYAWCLSYVVALGHINQGINMLLIIYSQLNTSGLSWIPFFGPRSFGEKYSKVWHVPLSVCLHLPRFITNKRLWASEKRYRNWIYYYYYYYYYY